MGDIIYGGSNKIVVKSVNKTAGTIGAAVWTGTNVVGTQVNGRDDLGIDIVLDQEDSSDAFRTLMADYRSEKAAETSTTRKYEDSTQVGGTVQSDVPLVWVESYGGKFEDESKIAVTAGFFYVAPSSGSFSQAADEPNKPSVTFSSVKAPFDATAGAAGDTTLDALVDATATIVFVEGDQAKTVNVTAAA